MRSEVTPEEEVELFALYPKSMLPVKLPKNINLNVKGNPLDHQEKWKKIKMK